MDYQGIYRAFESVGMEAAKRLREKVSVERQLDRVATTPAPVPPAKAKSAAEAEARKLYEYAQQLKRDNEFNKARAAFERVANTNETGGAQWKTLSQDELTYGLLAFEAKYWQLQLGSGTADPTILFTAINNAERLYREVVALNGANLERTTEAHRELDNLAVSRRALGNALRQSAFSRAAPVRMMLLEYYMSEGVWPDENMFRQMLREAPAGIELSTLMRTAKGFDARLTDKTTAKTIHVIGTNDLQNPVSVEVD